MKIIYFIFIAFIFIGCSGQSSHTVAAKHPLMLRNLEFADYEKENLSLNHVDSVLMIFHEKNSHDEGDTLAYRLYDDRGNIMSEISLNMFGPLITYKYDSLDFVINKTKESCESDYSKVKYHFVPDSLVLYQYWIDVLYNSIYDTTLFRFDITGKLLEKTETRRAGARYNISYQYRTDNKLSAIKENFSRFIDSVKASYVDDECSLSSNIQFYYSNEKLDSAITKRYRRDGSLKVIDKTYFNNKGLKWKEVYNDKSTLIYVYKIKNEASRRE